MRRAKAGPIPGTRVKVAESAAFSSKTLPMGRDSLGFVMDVLGRPYIVGRPLKMYLG